MSARNRRGFTLVELLVSMIMLLIVGGAFYQLLLTVQRVSTRQTEVSALRGNLRAGMQLIQSELSEVFTNAASATTDIVSMSATAFQYRAMRGVGETCDISTSQVKAKRALWNGKIPTADDSLMLLWDHDSTKVSDDTWVPLDINATPNASNCPDGITAAMTLSVNTTANQRDSTYVPSLVRTYEVMEIGSVTDAGQLWLGIRSVSGGEATLIPVIGPLATGGLNFTYRDASGSVTAVTSAVKIIQVTLIGVTDRRVSTGVGSGVGTVVDTLQFRVQLRNSR